MKLFLPIFFILVVLQQSATGQFRKKAKTPAEPVNFTLHEIAAGVWAAIQNDQYGKAICNAGIIDLGDKTVVFDPFMNPSAARELRAMAEHLTKRPVSVVINSHFHNDHIRGNQVFADDANIISTRFTRDEIARVEPEEQAWEARHAPTLLKAITKRKSLATHTEQEELPLWIGYYEGMVESSAELRITLPNILFSDSLWILGSERDILLKEFKGGHTKSDIVLLLPGEQIAFMGDLLVTERHPWLSDGEPEILKQILKAFYEDNVYLTYVPGHGPVSDRKALQDLHHYLTNVKDLCTRADTDSLRQDLLNQPIPSLYQNWYFGRFYHPNLQFLLGEMRRKQEIGLE